MTDTTAALSPVAGVGVVVVVLLVGVTTVVIIDRVIEYAVAGFRPTWRAFVAGTAGRAALVAGQRPTITERPDVTLWLLAPGFYGACAAVALSVVPFTHGVAVADVRTGIVVFGAVEVLTMVGVYLHGWATNSYLPLIGGYRFVAMVLSTLLVSMFVLIAAALPAGSLSFGAIIDSQRHVWNVVRQPLGLPLWLVVGLATAFWGPFDVADGEDLAGGTSAEISGWHRLAWGFAQRAMLVAYAVAGAAVFLGGYHGPWLPGALWMAVKTLAVLAVLVAAGHVVGRWRIERVVNVAWTVLLPLAFVHLVEAGVVALVAGRG